METAAEGAELAFLSACHTSVDDKKVPEESARLAAGMLATMWSMRLSEFGSS